MKQAAILIFTFLISIHLIGQESIQGSFKGSWASTYWDYNFKKDGTFTFKSTGHFGYTITKGKYEIKGDTIVLNAKGERNKVPPALDIRNEKLIIDGDSCVIDYNLRYDYCNAKKSKRTYEVEKGKFVELEYSSRKRNIKFPQTKARTKQEEESLVEILMEALNDSTLLTHYQFENKELSRKPIITSYFEFDNKYDAKIQIQNHPVQIIPKAEITEKFYIEIEDINITETNISIKLRIKEERIRSSLYLIKNDKGIWKVDSNTIY